MAPPTQFPPSPSTPSPRIRSSNSPNVTPRPLPSPHFGSNSSPSLTASTVPPSPSFTLPPNARSIDYDPNKQAPLIPTGRVRSMAFQISSKQQDAPSLNQSLLPTHSNFPIENTRQQNIPFSNPSKRARRELPPLPIGPRSGSIGSTATERSTTEKLEAPKGDSKVDAATVDKGGRNTVFLDVQHVEEIEIAKEAAVVVGDEDEVKQHGQGLIEEEKGGNLDGTHAQLVEISQANLSGVDDRANSSSVLNEVQANLPQERAETETSEMVKSSEQPSTTLGIMAKPSIHEDSAKLSPRIHPPTHLRVDTSIESGGCAQLSASRSPVTPSSTLERLSPYSRFRRRWSLETEDELKSAGTNDGLESPFPFGTSTLFPLPPSSNSVSSGEFSNSVSNPHDTVSSGPREEHDSILQNREKNGGLETPRAQTPIGNRLQLQARNTSVSLPLTARDQAPAPVSVPNLDFRNSGESSASNNSGLILSPSEPSPRSSFGLSEDRFLISTADKVDESSMKGGPNKKKKKRSENRSTETTSPISPALDLANPLPTGDSSKSFQSHESSSTWRSIAPPSLFDGSITRPTTGSSSTSIYDSSAGGCEPSTPTTSTHESTDSRKESEGRSETKSSHSNSLDHGTPSFRPPIFSFRAISSTSSPPPPVLNKPRSDSLLSERSSELRSPIPPIPPLPDGFEDKGNEVPGEVSSNKGSTDSRPSSRESKSSHRSSRYHKHGPPSTLPPDLPLPPVPPLPLPSSSSSSRASITHSSKTATQSKNRLATDHFKSRKSRRRGRSFTEQRDASLPSKDVGVSMPGDFPTMGGTALLPDLSLSGAPPSGPLDILNIDEMEAYLNYAFDSNRGARVLPSARQTSSPSPILDSEQEGRCNEPSFSRSSHRESPTTPDIPVTPESESRRREGGITPDRDAHLEKQHRKSLPARAKELKEKRMSRLQVKIKGAIKSKPSRDGNKTPVSASSSQHREAEKDLSPNPSPLPQTPIHHHRPLTPSKASRSVTPASEVDFPTRLIPGSHPTTPFTSQSNLLSSAETSFSNLPASPSHGEDARTTSDHDHPNHFSPSSYEHIHGEDETARGRAEKENAWKKLRSRSRSRSTSSSRPPSSLATTTDIIAGNRHNRTSKSSTSSIRSFWRAMGRKNDGEGEGEELNDNGIERIDSHLL